MKLCKKIGITIIILAVLILLLFKVFKVQDIIMKKIYPLKYTEFVEKYANENNIDKWLILAIIKCESNFESNITSKSGAIGLMQLMDKTAEEMAEKLDIEYSAKQMLYQPEVNIQIGTKYFAELLEQYSGNVYLALTAYNAGIGNVTKWIENGTIKEDGSDIENIPYKETNNYVRKILRDYKIYMNLYGGNYE